jgi:predicted DNA-binding transcriptional regulator AlpA
VKTVSTLIREDGQFSAFLDTTNSPASWDESSIFAKNKLLRISDVSNLTTLAKSTINLWEATGRFPKSLTLSPTIKVWTLESISNWIKSQGDSNE